MKVRTTEAVLPWELLHFFSQIILWDKESSSHMVLLWLRPSAPYPGLSAMSQLVPRLGAGIGGKLTSTIQALHFLWAPSWVHAGNQLPGPHQCEDDLSAEEEHLLILIQFSLGLRTELRALPGNKAAGTGPKEC